MILFMLFVGEMLPLSMMMFVLKFLTQGSLSRKKDVKLVPEFGAIYPFAANICTVEYQLTSSRRPRDRKNLRDSFICPARSAQLFKIGQSPTWGYRKSSKDWSSSLEVGWVVCTVSSCALNDCWTRLS
jgi:hypothetical protein